MESVELELSGPLDEKALEGRLRALKSWLRGYRARSYDLVDDFVGYCGLVFVERKRSLKTPSRYLWVDFLRHYLGRYDGYDKPPEFAASGMGWLEFAKSGEELEDRVMDRDELLKMRNLLSDKFQQIFDMRCDGFSHQEIGDFLGVSESMVSRHIAAMKKFLMKKGFTGLEEHNGAFRVYHRKIG